jgi:hypothetical protein
MAQFDRFIERNTPPSPRTTRVFSVVFPVLMTVKAIATRRLEDILTAIFFDALLLPSGLWPTAHGARLKALDRHPVLGPVAMFVLTGTGVFVLLGPFLTRRHSLYVALPAAVVLTAVGTVRRRVRAGR